MPLLCAIIRKCQGEMARGAVYKIIKNGRLKTVTKFLQMGTL